MQNELPKIDLTTFMLSVASAAFMGLGVAPPGTTAGSEAGSTGAEGESNVNLELARQNIDLLELMWEKTKGNRTPEEDKLLEQLLFETRMRFVEIQKRLKSRES